MIRPKKPRARSGKHLHAGVLVRAPDAEREAWEAAAELAGVGRAAWIRQTLAKETRRLFGAAFELDERLLGRPLEPRPKRRKAKP